MLAQMQDSAIFGSLRNQEVACPNNRTLGRERVKPRWLWATQTSVFGHGPPCTQHKTRGQRAATRIRVPSLDRFAAPPTLTRWGRYTHAKGTDVHIPK